MNNSIFSIFQNKVFIAINCIKERRFNFRWVIGTGGMPSAHSAGVMSLATAVGIQQGFDSVVFIITLVFAVVIAFDAQGVRRATGQQAEILNKILDDIYWRRKIQEDR